MATVCTTDVRATERPHATTARIISDIFSPPVLSIPALMLIAWCSHDPKSLGYVTSYFLIGVMAPVLYVIWLLKTGRIDDFHLPHRSDRTRPFLVSLGCGIVAVGLLIALDAPADTLNPIVVLLTQTLLLFVISLFWKVSVHTATTAGLVTFAVMSLGESSAFLLLLLPLVGWARVYLKRHTLGQAVAGAALGTCCFLVMMPMLHSLVR